VTQLVAAAWTAPEIAFRWGAWHQTQHGLSQGASETAQSAAPPLSSLNTGPLLFSPGFPESDSESVGLQGLTTSVEAAASPCLLWVNGMTVSPCSLESIQRRTKRFLSLRGSAIAAKRLRAELLAREATSKIPRGSMVSLDILMVQARLIAANSCMYVHKVETGVLKAQAPSTRSMLYFGGTAEKSTAASRTTESTRQAAAMPATNGAAPKKNAADSRVAVSRRPTGLNVVFFWRA